ncbi:hypothetical protein [Sphingomonas sp. XXL09]|uniref:hypothetical protein n=1 Tax=Sphingomonas sp. XXL09 TaxID=3457787 RepID=UPI00406BA9B5
MDAGLPREPVQRACGIRRLDVEPYACGWRLRRSDRRQRDGERRQRDRDEGRRREKLEHGKSPLGTNVDAGMDGRGKTATRFAKKLRRG